MTRKIIVGLVVGFVLSLFLTRPLVGMMVGQTTCQGWLALAEDADPNEPPDVAE